MDRASVQQTRRGAVALVVVAVLFTGSLVAPRAAEAAAAAGHLDVAASTGSGLRVAGWARDADDPSASLAVHIYVKAPGESAPGVLAGRLPANQMRSDPGLRGLYGFDGVLPVPLNPDLIYEVRARAVGVPDGAEAELVGVTTLGGAPPPTVTGQLGCGAPVPAGAVVTGQFSDILCRTTGSQLVVAAPQVGMSVCSGFVLPAGWQRRPDSSSTIHSCGSGSVSYQIEHRGTPQGSNPFACLGSACAPDAPPGTRPFDPRCAGTATPVVDGAVTDLRDGTELARVTMYQSAGCQTWWTTLRPTRSPTADAEVTMRGPGGAPYVETDAQGLPRYVNRPDRFYNQALGVTELHSAMSDASTGGQPPLACGTVRPADSYSRFGNCVSAAGADVRLDTLIQYGGVEEPVVDPPPVVEQPAPPPPSEPSGEWVDGQFIPFDELYPLPEEWSDGLPPGVGGPVDLPCNTPGLVYGDPNDNHLSVWVVPESESLGWSVNLGTVAWLTGGTVDVTVWAANGVKVQNRSGPALAGALGDEVGGLLAQTVRIRAELIPQPNIVDSAPAPVLIADQYCEMPDRQSLWIPGGGLWGHENAFSGGLHASGGHTNAKHVGRDLAFLQDRLDKEPIPAAGTFDTLADAERWIRRSIDFLPPGYFQAWLNDQSEKRLAVYYYQEDTTGQSLIRHETQMVPVNGVFVLVYKDSTHLGWHVQTAYPTR